MESKFKPGQKVVADGRVCEVVGMAYSGGSWSYTVSSREWNPQERALVEGVEHHTEDELEAHEE